VKRSRGGSRQKQAENMLTTPERKRRAVRELYLPEITKNTAWVKRKEVDLTTLYEDPFFDLYKKPVKKRGFRTGKASLDPRLQFGKIPGEDPEEEQTAAQTTQHVASTTQKSQPSQAEEEKAKMRTTTQKAADDVEAAQKFFDEK